jgi:hypothetical protein
VRIEWAATATEVGQTESGETAYVGLGGDTSPVTSFPCEDAWVLIVARLTARWDEMGAVVPETGNPVPHRLRWAIRGPDTATIAEGEGQPFGLLEPSPWHRAGWDGHHIEIVRPAFVAPEAGPYEIELRVDDSPAWTLSHYFALLGDLF